ncbi:uncharacterized protein LOC134260584 [Saccostrea cucullata]|uniref:uncharacterized protein LOC134260584 n=1 Tax=Saccostrea cuccullata TaxID=36930 RepID=UPI002ED047DF
MMDHLHRLSEAVYVGLCREVGSPTEVRIRREVMDTVEMVNRPVYIMRGFDRMQSGSRREGFRLITSDVDWMFWYPDHKVICDLSQISLYRIPQHTVILMEGDDLPTGFTRLNLMTPSNDAKVSSSCVIRNNNVFISSALFRDYHLDFERTCNVPLPNVFSHGPCSTHSILHELEADNAFCFQSHYWPTSALPWIQRCCKKGWPNLNVISDILSGGFHVVPIGSAPENELEWRISFSRGEQTLVYSMNHCQFMCYGLFKLFLKEVINCQTNTPTLCSYFIKTIVFWVIQTNTSLSWTPDNLLSCFWESFKLLIYMVYKGECPNFFIPQNNMFRQKVTGSVQTSLFSQMYDLYCKGISCLLLSQTMRPYIRISILNRTLRFCTDESRIISKTKLDICLFSELSMSHHSIQSFDEFAVCITQMERMIRGGLTSYQPVIIQYITSNVLRNTAIYVQRCIYKNGTRNKVYYKAKVDTLLRLSLKFGFLSDILYLSMHFYRTRRYEDSLSCLHKTQERMSFPYVIYKDHVNVDVYRHCMERKTLGTKMRRAVVGDIDIYCIYSYLDELMFEQEISNNNGIAILHIPILMMLHTLFILNHHRLGDTVRSQQSLQDLHTLLLYDDGIYVPHLYRDISWQILGICQQICGDYSGSLQSFRYSSQQIPLHKLQEATKFRISSLPIVAV